MKIRLTIIALSAAAACSMAVADTGKLLLTGGVSSIDGAAGGGLTPWATIGTNATAGEMGVSAHLSRAVVTDYQLNTMGIAFAFDERFEVSFAQQEFNASPVTALNGLGFSVQNGQRIKMDVLGLKVKVAGDAVLDSDTLMPQIALGVEQKSVNAGSITPVLDFLGAKTSGTDFYVSATKLFLANSLLVNGTLRYTNANQNGLVGFGSKAPGTNSASWVPEFSLAYLVNKKIAIGAEYRAKPNNLRSLGQAANLGEGLQEDAWKDVFIAWAPNKNTSLTLAYLDLGRILPGVTSSRNQSGYYLSGQFAF
ncbi:DUF3034 family protein [Rhodoferax sp. TBRC 17660]|uniref:DUF3034 family protein n=1 Tax=Rhodoferax potami TaxID=3068338 RepID=A0ABU3KQ63_9BURK|nr:DUF3034 family protein [Rhodoferax sp. TBRC 17660]MDT7519897.1 DUF3034 family protein [Rhodoferax sp. TBRC 17660]